MSTLGMYIYVYVLRYVYMFMQGLLVIMTIIVVALSRPEYSG